MNFSISLIEIAIINKEEIITSIYLLSFGILKLYLPWVFQAHCACFHNCKYTSASFFLLRKRSFGKDLLMTYNQMCRLCA